MTINRVYVKNFNYRYKKTVNKLNHVIITPTIQYSCIQQCTRLLFQFNTNKNKV